MIYYYPFYYFITLNRVIGWDSPYNRGFRMAHSPCSVEVGCEIPPALAKQEKWLRDNSMEFDTVWQGYISDKTPDRRLELEPSILRLFEIRIFDEADAMAFKLMWIS